MKEEVKKMSDRIRYEVETLQDPGYQDTVREAIERALIVLASVEDFEVDVVIEEQR
jgi:hypothetical protein